MAGKIDPKQLSIIGLALDRATTVEMRLGGYSRGALSELYNAAFEAQGGRPLSYLAAKALLDSVGAGDVVLIATGAGDPEYLPVGETDGPLGAAALGTILSSGLGAVPLFVTAEAYSEHLSAVVTAGGLGLRSQEEALRLPGTTAVMRLSSDDEANEEAEEYLDHLKPKAIIAIETLAPNKKGIAHTASGKASSPLRPRVEVLVDRARERGILTIGIGDNGNEVGFGKIEDAVREHKAYGDACVCPCGGGIASCVATDLLVVANTSNWGAYAVEAMLAGLLGNIGLLHASDTEQRMLERSVDHGAADGSTGRHILAVDGTGLSVQVAVLTILRSIIENGIAQPPARSF